MSLTPEAGSVPGDQQKAPGCYESQVERSIAAVSKHVETPCGPGRPGGSRSGGAGAPWPESWGSEREEGREASSRGPG